MRIPAPGDFVALGDLPPIGGMAFNLRCLIQDFAEPAAAIAGYFQV
jgi:hypothetical protein